MHLQTTLLLATASLASARQIPSNIQSFYSSHLNENCPSPASIKYTDGQTSAATTVYCRDTASRTLYLKGNPGNYADMDIDCDGANSDQGACSNDGSGQTITAFQSIVSGYGIQDLDAHIHTYVVLGNDNSAEEGTGGESFDVGSVGVQPLSLVAVVCGGNMFYGIYGDINGGNSTGEAALSVGQLCYGNDAVSGDNGHTEHDVLYIAFEGEDAVPGTSGANWKANTKEEFEASLASLGDSLVQRIGGAAAVSEAASNGVRSRVMRFAV